MRTLAVLAVLMIAALPARAGAQDIGLPIGATPEAASVEDLDGAAVDLARYVGKKPVLFEFWATWCELCAALEPRLQAAKRTYGDRVDFVIVAVGVGQNPRSIRRHLEDHTTAGPVLYDAKGAAVRAFKAPTTSYVVVLDAAGKVAYTGTGGNQDIARALARVVGSH
jgi:thiol-disulfide isomerase/thioredoxin